MMIFIESKWQIKKIAFFFVKQLEYGCVCVCAINKQSYSDDPNRKIRWLHNFVISILSSIRFFSKNLTKQKKRISNYPKKFDDRVSRKKIENKPIIVQLYSIIN